MSKWQFGDVQVERVLEFEDYLLTPSQLYPESTAAEIDEHRHWLEPFLLDPDTQGLHLAFHTFVIRSGNLTILVDTCGGNDKQRPQKQRYHLNNWPYLERLAAIGVQPEAVDYVCCTHLHVDHVGWNTQLIDGRWVPTFPNAKYLFSRPEWDYWEAHYETEAFTDDPYYEDSILPVIAAGQAEFVEMDFAFNDEIFLDPTPGHTPGHVCIHIRSHGREAVMSGDLMHHPIQCARPDWNSCFCVDLAGSRNTRLEFLQRYADTNTLIMPAHFPTPSVGFIVPRKDRWHFNFDPGEVG